MGTLILVTSSTAAQVTEFERNAGGWKSAAPCFEAYAFDQFIPGETDGTGCLLNSPLDPVTFDLAGGSLTISARVGSTPVCPIHDGSTNPAVSDCFMGTSSTTVVLEFSPPVTAFHTYYGSLAVGAKGTMAIFSGRTLMATLVSAASPHAVNATGHGFTSVVPIDRIEITTNDGGGAILGAFVGLASGEPSLGTRTIAGYNGPSGVNVQLDFACAFDLGYDRVTNVTQGTTHRCVRSALLEAVDGDVLVLEPSVFHEAIDLGGKAVTITSADPDDPDVVAATMLDAGAFQTSAIRCSNGEGPGTILRGITVTGGVASAGGGLFVGSNAAPTIDRCVVVGNLASSGGGIHAGAGSNPILLGCTLENNVADHGGAINADGATIFLSQCDLAGNSATFGGAVRSAASTCTFVECSFVGNAAKTRGGGFFGLGNRGPQSAEFIGCLFDSNTSMNQGAAIAAWEGGELVATDCRFTSNRVGGDGGAVHTQRVWSDIQRCDFDQNSASRGAAIFLSGGTSAASTIANCRFVGNAARDGGAGGGGSGVLYVKSVDAETVPATIHQCVFSGNNAVGLVADGGSVLVDASNVTFSRNRMASVSSNESALVNLVNCILWSDSPPELHMTLEGKILWHHCDIQGTGGSGGQGNNLDASPNFVDTAGLDGVVGTYDDDLRLESGSPCIDAGSDLPGQRFDPKDPDFDLLGIPRHLGVIDLGATEYPWDCDGSGTADYLEIAEGVLDDCNLNLFSDSCESILDCNGNGVMDECDIAAGILSDANANGFADECEVAGTIPGTVSWTVVNRPVVLLSGDCTVTGDLSIGAGVKVLAADGTLFQVAAGGSLTIDGVDRAPVLFTSHTVNPVAGAWDGIRFLPGSEGAIAFLDLGFTRTYGIRIESAAVSVADSLIHDVAGIDRPNGTSLAPALAGGPAFGISVNGVGNPLILRTTVHSVRGGHGGRGACGVAGVDGAWGPDGTAPGDSGGNGSSAATTGGPGADGARGGDAVGIDCGAHTAATLRDNLVRGIRGGDGGDGGLGGLGGAGGRGGHGITGNVLPQSIFYPFYTFLSGALGGGDPPPAFAIQPNGGGGGDGGDGTAGGAGGDGGEGGDAWGIRFDSASAATIEQNIVGSVAGGSAGAAGAGGAGGAGGDAGWGGLGLPIKIPGTGITIDGEPGAGGDGGHGAAGGNGGHGGAGGGGTGVAVKTAAFAALEAIQLTIAHLAQGGGGAAGSEGSGGSPGLKGLGGFALVPLAIDELCPDGIAICQIIINQQIEGDAGVDGNDGPAGTPGTAGLAGAVTGIIADGLASVTVANSILDGTDASPSIGATTLGSGSLLVTTSLLHGFDVTFDAGVVDLGGNGFDDPLLTDPEVGDFRLLAGSPAIDAGENDHVPASLAFDIAGLPRIVSGGGRGVAIVDLGAHEFASSAGCPSDFDASGAIDAADLAILLGAWGTEGAADVDGSGEVDAADLAMLLGSWGPC